ncbi:hypothetical protein, partial [Sutterella massiliensis]|uniref:hypothetical protein n=1 Tax=Sutterella massiliensis TaxID=1816689 RepID=UPI0019611E00
MPSEKHIGKDERLFENGYLELIARPKKDDQQSSDDCCRPKSIQYGNKRNVAENTDGKCSDMPNR